MENENKNLDRLANILKKPINLKNIKKNLEYGSMKELHKDIQDLKHEGYDVRQNGNIFFINREAIYNEKPNKIPVNEFGIVSDTHLGSKVEELEKLQLYYDLAKEKGIKHVFHCGDVTEGINIYRGQINDLKKIGVTEQVEHVIENYPKEDKIKTHFILGNHDMGAHNSNGVDIGKIISANRKDLDYIGQYYGRIDVGDGILLDMVHPAGGSPYSIGYGAQKYIRAAPPSTRSDIIAFGHWHQNMFTQYDDMYVLEAGCFTGTTDFLRRKGITSVVGGWFNEVQKENGKITGYKPEWVTF